METRFDPPERLNDGYETLEHQVAALFDYSATTDDHLFTVQVNDLWDLFLKNIPENARQHYTCNACRAFFNHFGNIVRIDANGAVESAMFPRSVPPFFEGAVNAVREAVEAARVNGIFLTKNRTLGFPNTNGWTHFHAIMPKTRVLKNAIYTAGQVMAEKREDYRVLCDSLRDFREDIVDQAITILETNALSRGDKVIGCAKWFDELQAQIKDKPNKVRENLIWRAVAYAPPGFTHVRSSMIGTLLEDLTANLPFSEVKARFEAKMNPAQYMRAQTAPKAGNVRFAESVVAKLGIEKALYRRYAKLSEIPAKGLVWAKPQAAPAMRAASTSLFGHLVPDTTPKAQDINIKGQNITFVKFRDTVLPKAEKIEAVITRAKQNFGALLTATFADAPVIHQWDDDDDRNQFSHYYYTGGSEPKHWNLVPGFAEVSAVVLQPSMWTEKMDHQGKSAFFIIDGAYDTDNEKTGTGIFPETLRADFKPIRSTIEAFSRAARLADPDKATACGIGFRANKTEPLTVRVTNGTVTTNYTIDRWD